MSRFPDRCGRRSWQPPATLALWALLLVLGAWVGLGLRLEDYRLLSHPFALPGARGLPGAGWFNVLVFVLPGALLAVLADGCRRQLPQWAGWSRRFGCTLALLAALGWMGQGLLVLDLTELDGAANRWHAMAWGVWQIAAGSAALLMALAVPGLRAPGAALIAVFVLPGVWPAGSPVTLLAQPLAVLVWAGWMWALTRRAAACWH